MRAKRPVASAKAKPRTAYWKSWPRREGLRATPWMRPPKTVPIPTPAPARPTVAIPAPWILAAATMAAAVDSATMPRDWTMLTRATLRMAARGAGRAVNACSDAIGPLATRARAQWMIDREGARSRTDVAGSGHAGGAGSRDSGAGDGNHCGGVGVVVEMDWGWNGSAMDGR